jgi:hypothetical protein
MPRSLLLIALLSSSIVAQSPVQTVAQSPVQSKVRNYRVANEQKILQEFLQLLAIPNLASDNSNIRQNAALIMEMMKARGLGPRLLEARTPNTPPVVFAEWKTPGAQRTLILYAHYDGQPTVLCGPEANRGNLSFVQPPLKQAGPPWRRRATRSIRNGASTLVPLLMTKRV